MDREVCPTCGSDANGCSVRDVGSFCRGPRRVPPVPPSSAPGRRAVVLTMRPNATGNVRGVILFSIPPAAPRVQCRRCGVLVVWIALPTGGRLAVTSVTREAHDATCTGVR